MILMYVIQNKQVEVEVEVEFKVNFYISYNEIPNQYQTSDRIHIQCSILWIKSQRATTDFVLTTDALFEKTTSYSL